jgi:anthranilate synthase component 2/putative glutamine amidotransferase
VDCHHHQALDRIAAGLTPSAWAEDGVVEAVEVAGRRFCLGVQWHPEAGEDRRLFEALVDAAG